MFLTPNPQNRSSVFACGGWNLVSLLRISLVRGRKNADGADGRAEPKIGQNVHTRSLKIGVSHTCGRGVTHTYGGGVTHTCFGAASVGLFVRLGFVLGFSSVGGLSAVSVRPPFKFFRGID